MKDTISVPGDGNLHPIIATNSMLSVLLPPACCLLHKLVLTYGPDFNMTDRANLVVNLARFRKTQSTRDMRRLQRVGIELFCLTQMLVHHHIMIPGHYSPSERDARYMTHINYPEGSV